MRRPMFSAVTLSSASSTVRAKQCPYPEEIPPKVTWNRRYVNKTKGLTWLRVDNAFNAPSRQTRVNCRVSLYATGPSFSYACWRQGPDLWQVAGHSRRTHFAGLLLESHCPAEFG